MFGVVLAASLFQAQSGWAQYTTGAVGGVVVDATGAAVAGAAVMLRNEATGEVRRGATGPDGRYLFPALTPGAYALAVTAAGFGEVRAEVAATSSATVTEDVTVKPAGQSAVVEVSGGSPEINLADAQQTTTRDQIEITSLPNQTRNPEGLVTLEPAVTPMYSPRAEERRWWRSPARRRGRLRRMADAGGRRRTPSITRTSTTGSSAGMRWGRSRRST